MTEKQAWAVNGFLGVLLLIVLLVTGVYFLIFSQNPLLGVLCIALAAIGTSGIFTVQPNQAAVLIFFGYYLGTVRKSGLWLGVPFAIRRKISLKVRNFNSKKLKVNDVEGNPIEIAAVIVFKVVDSAKATFDVDSYEQFVEIQSETALRYVASRYPYDNFKEEGYSLRSNTDEVATELARELQSRLSVAGVEVIEARLTHLAYATEIASAMLQRQQASAIVSARQRIVEGAVGMVQMAIEEFQREGFELDEERKAAMINNLMVAIVSERSAQPVINSGSLY
ncbi:SPFH domain-containing protein [Aneurinibacillus aneurinilyticus]|jgi:regulator of protease activity HflC (stomatin/prohibitin superfamily)|uniref:SPFH domain-containing protein n=2 Tax=Aneurinibacillus aneurinilyticus TaxID=1391 RepID=A0A848CVC9_ANEAE|nr:SPFH domain-containing protein [Aneurinibacillus aneurinilyticus]ERI06731.1 SPFH/Band 7/PHB domain protein [Aneurinibacillus aneurinilyticus ATCC 12856]MCI1695179.1 SPFH domain-containing protein [Aneurinibacillus aneurinilyticus]MED0671626.1 SPFH domain-containing protein [Aneurinibacillus aneurinilyticus]MED0704978.1 SPFH domain-containing protein [Aneurinibacillus aneurinilyticus]MED0721581.1 SPFH domain-containing protein [Aneurinibacillus aneurinilyticus]